MDYREVSLYLHSLPGETTKLALENIRKVIDHLPFDFRKTSYLQIAGTNGKGSTSAYLASILCQAGYGVGLFTSPHLQDVRERISVNGSPISRRDFTATATQVRTIVEGLIQKKIIPNPPTFFEHLFLMALLHFHRKRVAWAVLEVGLGGRLDATTTVLPRACIITNISKDHTNILGTTIEKISREKAGIIRPGIPVICGCQPGSAAYRIIQRQAEKLKAQFHPVFGSDGGLECKDERNGYRCEYSDGVHQVKFSVSMRGSHQCRNAAIAVKTIATLRDAGLSIPERAITDGIHRTTVPARIEWIKPNRGFPAIILDGGHNPEGIFVLVEYLKQKGITGKTLIFGVLADKDWKTMVKTIAPWVDQVILTQPKSPRALPSKKLAPLFAGKKVFIEDDSSSALRIAKSYKKDIIITGSLYLAGEMRTLILRRHDRERKAV